MGCRVPSVGGVGGGPTCRLGWFMAADLIARRGGVGTAFTDEDGGAAGRRRVLHILRWVEADAQRREETSVVEHDGRCIAK